MSILDRVRNYISPIRENKYLDAKGKPKTKVVARASATKSLAASTRSSSLLNTYKSYYEGEYSVFASVNITAWNTVMVGHSLSSQDKNALELIQTHVNKLDLDSVLLDAVNFALVYGDSFIEIVRNSKGEITQLKNVNPITMNIDFDEFGTVKGFYQKIEGRDMPPLKPEDIIHIKLFSRPDSPYGISLIQPSLPTISRKMAADEAISNAIVRHGTTKYVVKVGDKETIPPVSVFNQIKEEFEDIGSMNEFIIPGVIEISTIDEKGVPGVEEYFNYFQTQVIIGMLTLEEALGMGAGSTEATAKIKEIMYERMIKSFQLKISNQVRKDLFNYILESNGFEPDIVRMRFNSVTDADEAVKAKWLGNLLRGYNTHYGEEKPFLPNEVRAMFGFPPLEEETSDKPKKDPKDKPKPKPEEPPEEDVDNEDDENE